MSSCSRGTLYIKHGYLKTSQPQSTSQNSADSTWCLNKMSKQLYEAFEFSSLAVTCRGIYKMKREVVRPLLSCLKSGQSRSTCRMLQTSSPQYWRNIYKIKQFYEAFENEFPLFSYKISGVVNRMNTIYLKLIPQISFVVLGLLSIMYQCLCYILNGTVKNLDKLSNNFYRYQLQLYFS